MVPLSQTNGTNVGSVSGIGYMLGYGIGRWPGFGGYGMGEGADNENGSTENPVTTETEPTLC